MAKEKEVKATENVAEAPKKNGYVKIKLFKDSYKYKDDVFVGVCGKTWQIKRGVEVEVPEAVAFVLEQSMKQDDKTADLITRESTSFKKAEAIF